MGAFPEPTPIPNVPSDGAHRLRDEDSALSAAGTARPGTDGAGTLMALDEAVFLLLDADREQTHEVLRRDRILKGCLADLALCADGLLVSPARTAILAMADRTEVLDRRINGGGPLWVVRSGAAALIAVGIAGALLAASARVLAEPSWFVPGLITCAVGFGPLMAIILFGVIGRRAALMERRRLAARTLDALARARVVMTDEKVPGPQELRQHAASIGQRDATQILRSRLQELVLDEETRDSLRRRRDSLGEEIDEERAIQLVARRSRDPVLALAGLRLAVHHAFERVHEHARTAKPNAATVSEIAPEVWPPAALLRGAARRAARTAAPLLAPCQREQSV